MWKEKDGFYFSIWVNVVKGWCTIPYNINILTKEAQNKGTHRLYYELCTHQAIRTIMQKFLNGVLTSGHRAGAILPGEKKKKRVTVKRGIN